MGRCNDFCQIVTERYNDSGANNINYSSSKLVSIYKSITAIPSYKLWQKEILAQHPTISDYTILIVLKISNTIMDLL